MKHKYVIKKFIYAESVQQALRLEKKARIHEIFPIEENAASNVGYKDK